MSAKVEDPSTQARVEPVDVFAGVASVVRGDTFLSLWREPARCDRIRHVRERAEALVGRHPGTIVACQFLLSTAAPPDRAGRAEARAGLNVVAPRARRLITVPLGDAVWHAVVRGIIRTALLVSGKSRLIKVAASAREAFDLLGEVSSPESPGRSELESSFDALYGALGLPPPARGPDVR
jgi:hypothetical protein